MTDRVWRIGRTAMLLTVMLAGCAQAPSTAPAASAPAVSYDGHYSGTLTLTGVASGADRSWCEAPSQFAVEVVQNAFDYSFSLPNLANMPKSAAAHYSATIARDGSFQGQSDMTGVILGKISGATMTGTLDGVGCAYKFTATRL